MKQTPKQNKNLILADLMYVHRHIAELKGYLDEINLSQAKISVLDLSLQYLNSTIRLIAESEIK